MRSFALFVDAGYFFAAATELASGKPVPRHLVECDYQGLVTGLAQWAGEQLAGGEPVRLLRCYWYDGAKDGVPTDEHIAIARLHDVKLRLGRKTAAGQKGVDGLIILDLVTLARDGRLDTAFVLSGDEDLREACLAAQQMGVRIVLLGVPPASQDFNQAGTLIREADEHHVLPKEFWIGHLTVRQSAAPLHITDHGPPLTDDHPLHPSVRAFVVTLRERLAAAKLRSIADRRPAIPQFVDVQLLRHSVEHAGRQLLEAEKRAVRATFWQIWDSVRPVLGDDELPPT